MSLFRFNLIFIESSVKLSFNTILRLHFSFHLILIKFLVKLSFSGIFGLNFHPLFNVAEFQLSRLSVDFSRISQEASCLFERLSAAKESSDETSLLLFFPALTVLGFQVRTEGLVVTVDKKWQVAFWYLIVWDYFCFFHSIQIKCHTWSDCFLARNKFL